MNRQGNLICHHLHQGYGCGVAVCGELSVLMDVGP